MSTTTSYRLCGIALLVGSVLSVAYYLIQGAFLNGNDLATIISPMSLVSSVIGFIGSVFVLLGLPGVYARQARRASILGLLGILFVWYVNLYQGVIIPFTSVTIISQMTAHLVPQSAKIAMTPPPAWTPFFLVSLVGQVLGILLLGIATLRARVFPRWIGWLLIATLVIGLVSQLPFLPEAVSNIAAIIGSVAIAGFGYELLRPERMESTQPAPTSMEVPVHA
ncbi:MAG: hypothetical protein NVSMB27_30540 [Ktedonobacteraceae bacterium]